NEVRVNNVRHAVKSSLVWLGCAFALFVPERLPAQEISRRLADFRQSMLLDVDGAAVKKLRTAEEHIQVQQWAEAVDLLRQIVEAHGDKLAAVAPNRYVNVRTYAHMLVAALPPAGLQVYRERIDPLV